MKISRPPKSLKDEGRKFWRQVLSEYDVGKAHDFKLLAAAASCLDKIEECEDTLCRDGLFQKNRYGQSVEHPASKMVKDEKRLFTLLIREMGLSTVKEPSRRGRLY